MNNWLATLLKTFRRKRKRGMTTADRQQLEAGEKTLQDRLKDSEPLDTLTVHCGTDLYFYLGDRQGSLNLLSRYLTQSLSVKERAWAWWELIDNLCLLGRCEETVAAHQVYMSWAETQWKQRHLSSSKFLLTIADCSWASCWQRIGKVNIWLEHFSALLAKVKPSAVNRLQRFYCYRTACRILREVGQPEEALTMLARVRALAEEDQNWERSWEMEVQAYNEEACIHLQNQDLAAVRAAGIHAIAALEGQNTSSLSAKETTRLATQYDNVAATMFLADLYDLSIPLHRKCLTLSTVSEFGPLALAAAVWATTKEREPVLDLLRLGAVRCRGDWFAEDFRGLAEFEDVRDDHEFATAVNIR